MVLGFEIESALLKQFEKLEAEFGIVLFQLDKDRVHLTTFGRPLIGVFFS
jgi:DNA-binding transcriptional LysR family regulator